MSYQEKKSLVFLISMILIYALYSLYLFQVHQDTILNTPNDLKFWGKAFFALILIIVVASIIIFIIFSIINKIVTNEDIPSFSDERDKLVDLKATKITYHTFSFGFLLAMGSQALDMQPWVMFITLIASCFISTIIGEITKIYLYRKGV